MNTTFELLVLQVIGPLLVTIAVMAALSALSKAATRIVRSASEVHWSEVDERERCLRDAHARLGKL